MQLWRPKVPGQKVRISRLSIPQIVRPLKYELEGKGKRSLVPLALDSHSFGTETPKAKSTQGKTNPSAVVTQSQMLRLTLALLRKGRGQAERDIKAEA